MSVPSEELPNASVGAEPGLRVVPWQGCEDQQLLVVGVEWGGAVTIMEQH